MPANKDIIHECPKCECAIAAYVSRLNGAIHEAKVFRSYKNPSTANNGNGQRGHTIGDTTIGGHATVHFGDRIFLQGDGRQYT